MEKAGQCPAICRIRDRTFQNASNCSAGMLVTVDVVDIMLIGLIEVSADCLASADDGMFDQAEKMNAAAQATTRTIRMGFSLEWLSEAIPGSKPEALRFW